MKFNKVDKVVPNLGLFDIIKYQLLTHCFLNSIVLSETELNCLSLLGVECSKKVEGKVRLSKFTAQAAGAGILGTATAVANCLSRIEHSRLFLKEGGGKKTLRLNPDLNIVYSGNILLQYKMVHVSESNALAGHSKENSGAAQPA